MCPLIRTGEEPSIYIQSFSFGLMDPPQVSSKNMALCLYICLLVKKISNPQKYKLILLPKIYIKMELTIPMRYKIGIFKTYWATL